MADAKWRVRRACHPRRSTAALGCGLSADAIRARGGAASRHDPASPTAAHAGDRALGPRRHPRRDGARRDGAPRAARRCGFRRATAAPSTGRTPSSAARMRELARGLIALGIAARATASRSSATRAPSGRSPTARSSRAGAVVVPDLPHELARGVPLRARALRRARGDRARTPRSSTKVEPIRDGLPRARARRSPWSRRRRRPVARRPAPTAARRGRPERVAERAARRSTPDDVATIVYTSGTTGPAEGLRAHARQLLATMRHVRAAARARRRRRRSSCSCRSRTSSRA